MAALPLAVVACKKPEYPACKRDKHCNQEAGEKCVDGVCQSCTSDADCKGKGPAGADLVCRDLRCAEPAAGQGEGDGLGAPCTQTTDCTGNLVCIEGKCSLCTDDVQCAPGRCDVSTGRCKGASCASDDDCGMDEVCQNQVCVPSTAAKGADPCGLPAVYFDFDSPKITAEVAAQLQGAAKCMTDQGKKIVLEAHADARGTEEYNILLTDKRGAAVKDFLVNLGVPADRLQVLAKGDLEATGTDESSWAKDRRVEFVWP